MGGFTPIANYLRRVLIEDIYGRLSTPARHASFVKVSLLFAGIMFPEGEAWLAPADENVIFTLNRRIQDHRSRVCTS